MRLSENISSLKCPFCSKECKNIKGLKIHIALKAKYENYDGLHRRAVEGSFTVLPSGLVQIKCNYCQSTFVLNRFRMDRRITPSGLNCYTCDYAVGDNS